MTLASSAGASTDPRLCGLGHTRADCGRAAAFLDLRFALAKRFALPYRVWQGQGTCTGLAGLLRYRCTFSNYGERGTATVMLGKAPTWRPTVTVTSLVCIAQPDRKGCP